MDIMHNQNAEILKINGNWAKESEFLKQRFPELTDEDLNYEPDGEADLLTRMSAKLNKTKEEVLHLIKSGQP